MDDRIEFSKQVQKRIKDLEQNNAFKKASKDWLLAASDPLYVYNFSWMGVPIIQLPQDIVALQEIIWDTKPEIIIETGVARGGSVLFYAGMQKMMNIEGKVIGIDIDIRPHNRASIESHPLADNIILLSGSSIDEVVFSKVKDLTAHAQNVLVVLDSMHTHAHVLKELELYTTLIKQDGYCVVMDTIIEDLPEKASANRPWSKGNNPKTAVWEFIQNNPRFVIDSALENKLQLTAAPDGYLKCIANK